MLVPSSLWSLVCVVVVIKSLFNYDILEVFEGFVKYALVGSIQVGELDLKLQNLVKNQDLEKKILTPGREGPAFYTFHPENLQKLVRWENII